MEPRKNRLAGTRLLVAGALLLGIALLLLRGSLGTGTSNWRWPALVVTALGGAGLLRAGLRKFILGVQDLPTATRVGLVIAGGVVILACAGLVVSL